MFLKEKLVVHLFWVLTVRLCIATRSIRDYSTFIVHRDFISVPQPDVLLLHMQFVGTLANIFNQDCTLLTENSQFFLSKFFTCRLFHYCFQMYFIVFHFSA
jgi:hypothetical protein